MTIASDIRDRIKILETEIFESGLASSGDGYVWALDKEACEAAGGDPDWDIDEYSRDATEEETRFVVQREDEIRELNERFMDSEDVAIQTIKSHVNNLDTYVYVDELVRLKELLDDATMAHAFEPPKQRKAVHDGSKDSSGKFNWYNLKGEAEATAYWATWRRVAMVVKLAAHNGFYLDIPVENWLPIHILDECNIA